MIQSFPSKFIVAQMTNKFPAFMQLKVHHDAQKILPLDPIMSHLNPVESWGSNIYRLLLVLSFYLHLGLRSGTIFFSWWFLRKFGCVCYFSYVFYRFSHLILCDLIIVTLTDEYKLWISSYSNVLHFPITSAPLCSNILLSTCLIVWELCVKWVAGNRLKNEQRPVVCCGIGTHFCEQPVVPPRCSRTIDTRGLLLQQPMKCGLIRNQIVL